MQRRNLIARASILLGLLILIHVSQVMAANIRSFIEGVRRKAPVVYVGSVREVHFLARTKFDIKARAVVSVSTVIRGPTTKPHEAIVDYSSFDEETPMLEGGPQYQLQTGARVVIFANSFKSTMPPRYLLQGSREELLQRVEGLRDSLRRMSADQLRLNEINEEDRHIQLALYERLGAYLRTTK